MYQPMLDLGAGTVPYQLPTSRVDPTGRWSLVPEGRRAGRRAVTEGDNKLVDAPDRRVVGRRANRLSEGTICTRDRQNSKDWRTRSRGQDLMLVAMVRVFQSKASGSAYRLHLAVLAACASALTCASPLLAQGPCGQAQSSGYFKPLTDGEGLRYPL